MSSIGDDATIVPVTEVIPVTEVTKVTAVITDTHGHCYLRTDIDNNAVRFSRSGVLLFDAATNTVFLCADNNHNDHSEPCGRIDFSTYTKYSTNSDDGSQPCATSNPTESFKDSGSEILNRVLKETAHRELCEETANTFCIATTDNEDELDKMVAINTLCRTKTTRSYIAVIDSIKSGLDFKTIREIYLKNHNQLLSKGMDKCYLETHDINQFDIDTLKTELDSTSKNVVCKDINGVPQAVWNTTATILRNCFSLYSIDKLLENPHMVKKTVYVSDDDRINGTTQLIIY